MQFAVPIVQCSSSTQALDVKANLRSSSARHSYLLYYFLGLKGGVRRVLSRGPIQRCLQPRRLPCNNAKASITDMGKGLTCLNQLLQLADSNRLIVHFQGGMNQIVVRFT